MCPRTKQPTVLWVSRHRPLTVQVEALRKLYGPDVWVKRDPHPFANVDEVIDRFKRSGAIDMVIVAPLSVIHQLVQRGIKPLHAVFSGEHRPRRFIEFMRVESYTFNLSQPTPRLGEKAGNKCSAQ